MYSNVKDSSDSKKLFWASISAAIILSFLVLFSLSSGANASALTPDGTVAPPPAPTIPPTLAPPTATSNPLFTATRTATRTRTPIGNPTATSVSTTPTVPHPVPTSIATPGSCTVTFSDVEFGAWFHDYVMWMACNGIVNGYPDGTFRPGNPATRGQIVKIVVGAFNLPINTTNGPTYADVSTDSTFYSWIETATFYGIINGYPCGGSGEPCNAQNQPYYRANNDVTRGQLTKILVLSAQQANPIGWPLLNPAQASFADVQVGSTFYTSVETAYAHGLVGGYDCGGAGEPCPGRYFRPGGNATRAQLSKMVYEAIVP